MGKHKYYDILIIMYLTDRLMPDHTHAFNTVNPLYSGHSVKQPPHHYSHLLSRQVTCDNYNSLH